ncbi:MAG: hypothetical protein LRZ85_01850 [Alphaproteobacteria bacterium]|nr:hypothetical protein [Alphaproteobacteria bacterium]
MLVIALGLKILYTNLVNLKSINKGGMRDLSRIIFVLALVLTFFTCVSPSFAAGKTRYQEDAEREAAEKSCQ